MALGVGRHGVVVALAQDPGREFRYGDQHVALREEKLPARPGTRALGHVARQDNLRPCSGKPRGKDRRPDVASVMAMHDLMPPPPQFFRSGQDEAEFGWTFPGSRNKRHAAFTQDAGELAAIGTSHRSFDAQGRQALGESGALVVRAAAGQERVEMEDAQGHRINA